MSLSVGIVGLPNAGKSTLFDELKSLIKNYFLQEPVGRQFLRRLQKRALTCDENSRSHFCVYFPAYDSQEQQVFLGHHKKSGLWLVNGGHIDQGELLHETIKREMAEEWGTVIPLVKPRQPDLLTLTKIRNNPVGRACRYHYDIWYFIQVNKKKFKPNFDLLAKEFFETQWLMPQAARKIVVDSNTLSAIKFLEEKIF